MRWWLLISIFCASPALAQWVQLTPCGLKGMDKYPEYPFEIPKGPAENLGPYWVWAPSVVAIMEIKPSPPAKARCSMVFTRIRGVLVIGTSREIIRKLGK